MSERPAARRRVRRIRDRGRRHGRALPGRARPRRFWRNLEQGVESIAAFSHEELVAAGDDPEQRRGPGYVRARPILDGVELFDAAFFGFSPREAEMLDPQHRLFLECAWEALEHAGYDTGALQGPIGVFAGAGFSNYLVHNLYKNRPVMEASATSSRRSATTRTPCVTMVGYKLNLKGPAAPSRRSARPRWWACTWPARASSATRATWRWPAA